MKKFITSLALSLSFALTAHAVVTVVNDNRHLITGEVGAGYSSLLHSSDFGKSAGLAGGIVQLGYEWNLRQFLLHAGVEFSSINNIVHFNSTYSTNPYVLSTNFKYGDNATAMQQHFAFSNYREQQMMGYVNIPVMAGGLFDDRYYFLAGVKVGLPVYGSYNVSSHVESYLTDPLLPNREFHNMPEHGADMADVTSLGNMGTAMGINVQAAAEVGVSISSFIPQKKAKPGANSFGRNKKKKPLRYYYRIGLFCDYGITSAITKEEALRPLANISEWNPDVERAQGLLPTTTLPAHVELNPYMRTANRLSSFLVGVKFAVLFQVNQPKKPVMPQSWLDVDVTDAATEALLPAQINVLELKTGRETIRQAKKGTLHMRTKRGGFTVTASAPDYYSDTQSYTIDSLGENVALSFALRHRPYFRFRVTHSETGEPMPVHASFINRANNDTILHLNTDAATGAARYMLEDSITYRIHIAQLGYETYATDIASIADSMNIVLKPIKKGDIVIVNHLFFANNSTRILAESESALNDLKTFLTENPQLRIRIVGHTDNVGSDQFNLKLSEGRAQSVKDALVKRGVAPERIETLGMGKRQPIATNDTEEGRAQNRRVELVIL